MARSNDSPAEITAAKTPEKQSPAPTVSMALTRGAENQRVPAALRQQTPPGPQVARTWRTPSRCKRRAAASTSVFRFVGIPVNVASSFSFGVRNVACRSRPGGRRRAGAGFSRTGTSLRVARTMARRTVAGGISSCTTRQRAARIAGMAESICSGRNSSFDPRATAMRFSPCPSTRISATPLRAVSLRTR